MEKYVSDFFRLISLNIRTIIKGRYEAGITDLNALCNLALIRLDRAWSMPPHKNLPRLSKTQRKQMKAFYAPYVRNMTDLYHRFYTAKTGKFYPHYIPEELYATHIDRYLSNRKEATYLDNKCYYYRIFSNIKQPELVVMRIGKSWLNSKLELISQAEAVQLAGEEKEVVVKKAVDSESGYGVYFMSGEEISKGFTRMMRDIPCDVVIQRPLRQHPMLAELHKESVNTLRIISLMTENKVKIYAVCLKIGVGSSRVDNGTQGGMYCGVNRDGTLKDFAIRDLSGMVVTHHPDLGYAFAGKKVPHLDRALRLVKKAHSFMGHFRLISWDISIDENGDAVLVEANFSLGGISNVQMCTGPLFGKDTKKILDEVFKNERK